MKKMFTAVLAAACAFSLAGCGSSTEEYDALLAENEQLKEQVSQLEAAAPQWETVRVSGSFEALVRHKLPGYLRDDFTPEAAVVTRFQDAPMVLYLGAELAEQVEEGQWYLFTIDDMEFPADSERPEAFVEHVLEQGYILGISGVTPCEPQGMDSPRLEFTAD